MITTFHTPTAFLILGLLFISMSVANWLSLKHIQSRTLNLWSIGGVVSGIGVLFLASREFMPVLLSFPVAHFLILLGSLLRIKSLRLEEGRTTSPVAIFALCLTAIAIFEFIRHGNFDHSFRIQYIAIVHGLAFGWLGVECLRIGKRLKSKNAVLIGSTHWFLAADLLVRALELFKMPADAFGSSLGNITISITGIVAVTAAHVAYTGMRLDQQSTKLETAENQFREVLRTARDGFFIIDSKGRFQDINDSFCDILGYSKAEMLRMSVADIETFLDQDGIEGSIKQTAETGFSRFETRDRRKDGAIIDVEVSVTPLPNSQNLQIGFLRDITKEKQFYTELEQQVKARTAELQAARETAESASAVKSSLIQNFSHEMRTPLTSIIGYAELGLTKQQSVDPENNRTILCSILEAAQSQSALVSRLLLIADQHRAHGIHKGMIVLKINIASLASDCVSAAREVARIRNQSVTLNLDATAESLSGNKTHIATALSHLLSNALRFSRDYGVITLQISDKKLPASERSFVTFRVIDSGSGVPEKELSAIFEPFYESTRTSVGNGSTGLGLPLCKSIAESHGGTLSASKNPSGGTIFEMILPV